MLKRLSMVLAATAVMGICMAMMPQKVEAKYVTHKIYHGGCYRGNTMIAGAGLPKPFILSGNGWATVEMGNVASGSRYSWAKMYQCGKTDGKWRTVSSRINQTFWFYPPRCIRKDSQSK